MQLKNYQQNVLNDLADFLDTLQVHKTVTESYNAFWQNHKRFPLVPCSDGAIKPYNDSITGVPHVCFKVPTAGGKTFLAACSIKTVFDHFALDMKKAVVWLVPSDAILEQTVKNLKDTSHPYRQQIDIDFSNRVEVYDKKELLSARGFSANSVAQNLSIFVLSFDSLRTKNKEGRKVYQDNGALQSFAASLNADTSGDDEISLMSVIQSLRPVVIVDESHNAQSELSVEMLKNLNPSFILDLTATPRENSNIISFVPALALKNENMVKLPVIVSNHERKEDVIFCALHLRSQLEKSAKEAQKKNKEPYVRPIVLFQAQPKTSDDTTTFEKIKALLIKLKIPEEEIKIKTSGKNELKGIDLMSPSCKVRYIITVNALKEGWDCPFAYILASIADRGASVDVEQILGRVLRLPYVRRHSEPLLNMSYVFTSSGKFLDTVQNVVKGLNAAGFTEKEYRLADPDMFGQSFLSADDAGCAAATTCNDAAANTNSSAATGSDVADSNGFDFDTTQISVPDENLQDETGSDSILQSASAAANTLAAVAKIAETAAEQNEVFSKQAEEAAKNEVSGNGIIPPGLEKQVAKYAIKDVFMQSAKNITLPQFSEHQDLGDLFGDNTELIFDKVSVLKDFPLNSCDININFERGEAQLYKVDLDVTQKDETPVFLKLDGKNHDTLMKFILDPKQKKNRAFHAAGLLMEIIGKMYPIPDSEIRNYIERIIETFTEEQFTAFTQKTYQYAELIKQKITALSNEYVKKQFVNLLDIDSIQMNIEYTFPLSISPVKTAPALPKSLYEKEGDINSFETEVINDVANMDNVEWWTRNIEKRGFCINGFINHYPDFIIKTKKGKIVVLETKGDHLDAESKIELGNLWAAKAGNDYRYFLVYNQRQVPGSKTKDEFLALMKQL